MLKYAATLCFLLGTHFAHAQVPSGFVGSWTVTWQGQKRPQQAALVINESGGGTWKTAASSKTDGCIGKEVPISFDKIEADSATVRLKFSESLTGCADAKIHIKVVSPTELTGTRGQAELSLVRN